MEVTSMSRVTVTESIVVRVGKVLRDKGFRPLHFSGGSGDEESKDVLLGFHLYEERKVPFLFFFNTTETFTIASLFLSCSKVGAETKKNWVFHVFGRDNVEKIKEISEDLSKMFKLNIHVRLEREKAHMVVGATPEF